MNVKHLRYALVLAHKGSFSRASDALSITQPSLNQYIKIETKLNITLPGRKDVHDAIFSWDDPFPAIGFFIQSILKFWNQWKTENVSNPADKS